jgi:HK97 family phage major capsid protein
MSLAVEAEKDGAVMEPDLLSLHFESVRLTEGDAGEPELPGSVESDDHGRLRYPNGVDHPPNVTTWAAVAVQAFTGETTTRRRRTMAWPFAQDTPVTRLASEMEVVREQAVALYKAMKDIGPGTDEMKRLEEQFEAASDRLQDLRTEWEREISKEGGRTVRYAGRVGGPRQPMLGAKAADAFVKQLGLGAKAFTDPAGAVLLPSIFVEDVWGALDKPPPLVFPRFPMVPVAEGGSVEYISNTVLTPAAAPVAPLALKPTTVVTLKREAKNIQTIATVSEPIDRHLLDDSTVALDFLGRALSWAVARAVDNEIVNGDATEPGFVGLLAVPGHLAAGPPTGGQSPADVLLTGVGALEANGYAPDLAILSAADWQAIRGAKSTQGDYLYGPPSQQTAPTVWGLDVVTTPALTAGTAVVVDTTRAAKLYTREVSRLSWTEAGAATELGAGRELFSSDALRFRCETRALLGVAEPGAIAVVDTAA